MPAAPGRHHLHDDRSLFCQFFGHRTVRQPVPGRPSPDASRLECLPSQQRGTDFANAVTAGGVGHVAGAMVLALTRIGHRLGTDVSQGGRRTSRY